MDIRTTSRIELVDITDRVQSEVHSSGIAEGICIVSTRHTTTSILINENESGLCKDILNLLERLVLSGGGYRHDRIDDNADAHLKAVLLGTSETIPVREGSLLLGTWQRIFFAELDGPRHRTVEVSIISCR